PATSASVPKRQSARAAASGVGAASSKWVHSSRRRSSRASRLGSRAPATIRSMAARTSSWSRMGRSEDGAHRGRAASPLLALRLGAPAAGSGQAVVFARPALRALAPSRFEQPGPLELVKRRVDSAFLELKRARAAALGFLQDLVAVHLSLGEQAEDQHGDSAGDQLSVVVHAVTLLVKVSQLAWLPQYPSPPRASPVDRLRRRARDDCADFRGRDVRLAHTGCGD